MVSILALSFLLWGCFGQKSGSQKGVNLPYVQAVYSMPSTYDPILMNEGTALILSDLIYEGLLRFDRFFGVEGALAKSWETSPDGKILTFDLRKNARFHNGKNLTGRDVVYSLSRLVSSKSLVHKYYDAILGAKEYREGKAASVKGLESPSMYIVKIILKKPFPPFIHILAGSTAKIFPEGTFESGTFSKAPFGAGPFKIESISTDKIVLKRFEGYYGEKAKLEKMVLKTMTQKDAISEAKAGKIHDLAVFPFSGKEDVFKKGKRITTPIADTWIVGINSRKPPFDRLEVRQAFRNSINEEKFRKTFYPDAIPAYGYIPKGFPGYVESERNPSGTVKIPPHSPITLFIPAELEKSQEMKTFLTNELATKRWKAKVKITPWATMMKKYNEKSMQSFLLAMNMDYPDSEFLLRNFESSNEDNFSGIKNAEIDRLLDSARKTQDRIERNKIYKRLAEKVNSLALTVNLFHSSANYWVHRCVEEFHPNPISVVYIDYRKIGFNKDCLAREIL